MPPFSAEGLELVLRPTPALLQDALLQELAALGVARSARDLGKPIALLAHDLGSLQLISRAHAQRTGISAGLLLDQPAGFVWRLVQSLGGTRLGTSPLAPGPLLWLVAQCPALQDVAEGAQRLRLAYRTAQALDHALTYRPQWIAAWMQDRSAGAQAEAWAQSLPASPRRVLVQVLERIALLESSHPLEALQSELTRALHASAERSHDSAVSSLRDRLPVRAVVVAGLSPLPQMLQSVFALLGRILPVRVIGLDPSLEFWEDARSARAQQIAQWVATDQQECIDAEPAILGAWGQEQRRCMVAWRALLESYGGAEDRIDALESEPPTSLLGCMQQEIATGHREVWSSPAGANAADGSLQLHATPSRWRQVEALGQCLHKAFAAQPDLRPEDCLILCSDLQSFEHPLAAVLPAQGWSLCWIEAGPQHGRHERNRLMATLTTLLQWGDESARIDALSEALQDAGLRAALAVDPAMWPEMQSVLSDLAGMRLAAASESIVLGLAADAQSESLFIRWNASWAYVGAQRHPEAAQAILACVQRLQHWQTSLGTQPTRTLKEWVVWSQQQMADWASGATAPWSLEALEQFRQALADVAALPSVHAESMKEAQALDVAQALDAQAWIWTMQNLLPAPRGAALLGQGLHVAALGKARSIPYRIVAVLGAEDGVLPAPVRSDPFNPLSADWQLGDPDPVAAQRAAWFEALLAARQAFWVFWSRGDLVRGAITGPSVLVQELCAYLDERLPTCSKIITTDHALLPGEAGAKRTATAGALLDQPAPQTPAPTASPQMPLADLARDLKRPLRRWWRERHGVRWPSDWRDEEDSLGAQANDAALGQALWSQWPHTDDVAQLASWPRLVHRLAAPTQVRRWRRAWNDDRDALDRAGFAISPQLLASAVLSHQGVRLLLPEQTTLATHASAGHNGYILLRADPSRSWETIALEASLLHCARSAHAGLPQFTSVLVHAGQVRVASCPNEQAKALLGTALAVWHASIEQVPIMNYATWWAWSQCKAQGDDNTQALQAATDRWLGAQDASDLGEVDAVMWRALNTVPTLKAVLEASEQCYRPLIELWVEA